MNTPPQQVTSRYARNLLMKGKNNEFLIKELVRLNTQVDTIIVGYYFNVSITQVGTWQTQIATGVTPEQGVNRCLAKHGVTFR